MKAVDLILLGLIALAVLLAAVSIRRRKKRGGACHGCTGNCSQCHKH